MTLSVAAAAAVLVLSGLPVDAPRPMSTWAPCAPAVSDQNGHDDVSLGRRDCLAEGEAIGSDTVIERDPLVMPAWPLPRGTVLPAGRAPDVVLPSFLTGPLYGR